MLSVVNSGEKTNKEFPLNTKIQQCNSSDEICTVGASAVQNGSFFPPKLSS